MTRTVLITGGSRGIGLEVARSFARDHNVAIVWNRTPPADTPDGVLCLQADLTSDGQCQSVVNATADHFGGIDVVVNNAGLVEKTLRGDMDLGAQRRILDVNLLVPAQLLSAALPHLSAGSAIVSISSVNAVLPPMEASVYGASKAALNLWTRGMAKELGPSGIRVNAVAPGAIETPDKPRPLDLVERFVSDTALGRIGTPEDIAKVVRFLAGPDAAFITGEIVTVSGGYRL